MYYLPLFGKSCICAYWDWKIIEWIIQLQISWNCQKMKIEKIGVQKLFLPMVRSGFLFSCQALDSERTENSNSDSVTNPWRFGFLKKLKHTIDWNKQLKVFQFLKSEHGHTRQRNALQKKTENQVTVKIKVIIYKLRGELLRNNIWNLEIEMVLGWTILLKFPTIELFSYYQRQNIYKI